MDGQSYRTISLKLRSSGAVPIGPGKFLVQSFGVDENEVRVWPATTTITRSNDFTGASIVGDLFLQIFNGYHILRQVVRKFLVGKQLEELSLMSPGKTHS
ncbi:hypothetical protein LCGC14_0717020 [marine sediment metagenome]|uniref:Uncharacterized protein n=1 Tax=marine sediment metagenome TaxID=412755 RepID=A0A0F9QHU8_9ZZZZ